MKLKELLFGFVPVGPEYGINEYAVYIVDKQYWEENHCLNDCLEDFTDDLEQKHNSFVLDRMEEGVYEACRRGFDPLKQPKEAMVSREEVESALIAAGMSRSTELEEWAESGSPGSQS